MGCVDVHTPIPALCFPGQPGEFIFLVVRSHTTVTCVALTAPVWFAHAHMCVYIGITSSVVPPRGSLLFCGQLAAKGSGEEEESMSN